MRTTAFLLVLAACSGGGGSAPFEASANIRLSHPFLVDSTWSGSLSGGNFNVPLGCSVRLDQITTSDTRLAVAFDGGPMNVGTGFLEASGDRFRVELASTPGPVPWTAVAEGRIEGTSTLRGTFVSSKGLQGNIVVTSDAPAPAVFEPNAAVLVRDGDGYYFVPALARYSPRLSPSDSPP